MDDYDLETDEVDIIAPKVQKNLSAKKEVAPKAQPKAIDDYGLETAPVIAAQPAPQVVHWSKVKQEMAPVE